MKNISFLILFSFVFHFTNAQIIKFPDLRFKEAIIASGADANFNKEIEKFEAETVVRLDISYKDISDITGIETLIKLQELICNENNISSINLFQNIELKTIICSNNPLKTLDISKNSKLQTLMADNTLLDSINVTENESLTKFSINNSKLISLDISKNSALKTLDCLNNPNLKSIYVFNIDYFMKNKKFKKSSLSEWVIKQ